MKNEQIKKWIKEAYDNAVERDFYECPDCEGSGEVEFMNVECYDGEPTEIYEKEDCDHCNGSGIDPNKNIGELLMLIVCEIAGAVEAHRCKKFAELETFEECKKDTDILESDFKEYIKLSFEENVKDTFEDELADVFIRLFDLCCYLGYEDIGKYLNESYGNCSYLKNTAECLFLITGHVTEFFAIEKIFLKMIDMAQIISMLFNYCKSRNIQIEKHIEAKMAYNRTRLYKHGKEY